MMVSHRQHAGRDRGDSLALELEAYPYMGYVSSIHPHPHIQCTGQSVSTLQRFTVLLSKEL